MKLNRILLLAGLIAAGTGFWSCEESEYFKSEGGVEKQLQGTWSLIPIPRTDPKEEWIFNDGTLYRKKGNNNGSAPVPFDTATYSVKTGLSSVKIKIENFKAVLDELNGTWDVVTLDNDILFIATDHDGTSGIMQREFQKKD